MNGEVMLSKWWRTDSCRRAFARVEEKRRERIDRMRRELAEKRQKLAEAVEQWEEKTL